MVKFYKRIQRIFSSDKVYAEHYRVWAKTEYGRDWQFALQHMLDHKGSAPKSRELDETVNKNLKGWV